jgi:voltage-dependent potassium channel beta subunit
MEYRKLGKSGLKLSALSLGSWVTYGGQTGEDVARECMTTAYDAGVNFFDGAEVYAKGRAEEVMGSVIAKAGWRRASLVLSTKIFWGGEGPNDTGLSHKHLTEGVHAALKRLRTDYVDLVFCHRPDPSTPIEETVRAFDVLIRQGKLFYWGTSEWSAEQLETAYTFAAKERLFPPTMEQPQYNLLVRERVEGEYAPLFKKYGLGTTIWSPLASGLLTGKYNDGVPKDSRLALENYAWLKEAVATEANLAKVKKLAPIAKELSCTLAQLSIAWCLTNSDVSSVLLGASRASQVTENLKALEVAKQLKPEVLAMISAAVA